MDVGDEARLGRMIDTTIAAFGRLDVLFNNALVTNPAIAARARLDWSWSS